MLRLDRVQFLIISFIMLSIRLLTGHFHSFRHCHQIQGNFVVEMGLLSHTIMHPGITALLTRICYNCPH